MGDFAVPFCSGQELWIEAPVFAKFPGRTTCVPPVSWSPCYKPVCLYMPAQVQVAFLLRNILIKGKLPVFASLPIPSTWGVWGISPIFSLLILRVLSAIPLAACLTRYCFFPAPPMRT